MIGIALAAMIVAVLAVHLGLPLAIVQTLHKISGCQKCASFWATLLATLMMGADIVLAAVLSITMAYLSFWVGVIFIWLQAKYNEIWERLNK